MVFLHGFSGDMQGTKALALAEFCAARKLPFVRFDCFAHGQSDGAFKDFTIGHALADALYVLDHLTAGPQILVGSSMGGWLAFLVARARPESVKAIIGIAPAPDFTDQFYFDDFDDAQRAELDTKGLVLFPSDYGAPYLITQNLIAEGRQHFVMDQLDAIKCPLRILHGQEDADVPWQQSLDVAARWGGSDAQVILVKDANHSLSRDQDLELLRQTLAQLLTA
jgi:pimeloyl-ACP methyl ester carboxylesterase